MLKYAAIEIFTSEEARHGKKPLVDAVVNHVRDLRIAARCIVTRGVAGCYESGETATGMVEVLSYNLPIRIYILLPAPELDLVLGALDGLVQDGIVVLHDLNVLSHGVRNAFLPRRLLVRDVMTVDPVSARPSTPLGEVVKLLLSSIFTGLPVVDGKGRPLGMITQGDLINRGGLPLRLGLAAESGEKHLADLLGRLAPVTAAEVMTAPVLAIAEDRPLHEAVENMLDQGVKRLPAVDKSGRLTGMLSRLDIFRTVMRESPDWDSFRAQKIEVGVLGKVGDILRRDAHVVSPDTPVSEVIQVIDQNDIQRVVVVDGEGRLLGLISDRDLLRFFLHEPDSIRALFSKGRKQRGRDACSADFQKCLDSTSAAMVMKTDVTTVREETLIEDAIKLMTEKSLKRLPVVDESGRFKGLINRDSLLRIGFEAAKK
ncbi:MAG: DUF190 domain-containing protein [Pseudomonadota bacterium]